MKVSGPLAQFGRVFGEWIARLLDREDRPILECKRAAWGPAPAVDRT